jgi:hypothetical protein
VPFQSPSAGDYAKITASDMGCKLKIHGHKSESLVFSVVIREHDWNNELIINQPMKITSDFNSVRVCRWSIHRHTLRSFHSLRIGVFLSFTCAFSFLHIWIFPFSSHMSTYVLCLFTLGSFLLSTLSFSFWIFPLFLVHSSLFAHTIYSVDFFAINHHSSPSHLQS